MARLGIGDPAPDFSLQSVDKESVCLVDFEDVPLIIVFLRSKTSPESRMQLAQLREDHQKLREGHVPVFVIAPHTAEELAEYWEQNRIPVIGLADPDSEVSKAYGQEFVPPEGWMPAMIGLDAEHKVAYTHYGRDQRDVATSKEIIDLMPKLAEAA
ncbi:MAG: hypothetical protein C4521_11670 [Actinobacteria bacterium]|nr:MAG: hypothetical protein C4521_11670 [Actinomycetota bacterium]